MAGKDVSDAMRAALDATYDIQNTHKNYYATATGLLRGWSARVRQKESSWSKLRSRHANSSSGPATALAGTIQRSFPLVTRGATPQIVSVGY